MYTTHRWIVFSTALFVLISGLFYVVLPDHDDHKEEKNKQTGEEQDGGKAAGEALGSMFSGFGPSGEDSVIVKCNDPD